MLIRSFSNNIAKLLCTNCRLYDKKTGLCKLNELYAFENRSNERVCGPDGKKYLAINNQNLIKSEEYFKYCTMFYGYTIASSPFAFVYDFRIFWSTYISWVFGWSFELLSREHEKKYLEDNDIRSNQLETKER
jgi:hypothetical protein